MDNLPVKYQPRVGDRVRRKGREGIVVRSAFDGPYFGDFPVIVHYRENSISFYPRNNDLEVLS